MNKSASEIIHELEMRIAQLEKESGEYKSTFDRLHDLHKKSVRKYDENNRSMQIRMNTMNVHIQESSNENANFLGFDMLGKTFVDEDDLTKTLLAIDKLLRNLQ